MQSKGSNCNTPAFMVFSFSKSGVRAIAKFIKLQLQHCSPTTLSFLFANTYFILTHSPGSGKCYLTVTCGNDENQKNPRGRESTNISPLQLSLSIHIDVLEFAEQPGVCTSDRLFYVAQYQYNCCFSLNLTDANQ